MPPPVALAACSNKCKNSGNGATVSTDLEQLNDVYSKTQFGTNNKYIYKKKKQNNTNASNQVRDIQLNYTQNVFFYFN